MNKWLTVMAIGLGMASAANAMLVDSGVVTTITVRDCISGVTACDRLSSALAQQYWGEPGGWRARGTLAVEGKGEGAALGSLSGVIGDPILRAASSSDLGYRANATVIALQSYTYIGEFPAYRRLGATLTYEQKLTGVYPGEVYGGGVIAQIRAFMLPYDEIDVGSTSESLFRVLSIITSLPGYYDLGENLFNDSRLAVKGKQLMNVGPVYMHPGDKIWVWSYLSVPSPNGSAVDAYNTMVTEWDDPTNLIPSRTVSEPETFALLALSSCLLMAGMRRPRRRT